MSSLREGEVIVNHCRTLHGKACCRRGWGRTRIIRLSVFLSITWKYRTNLHIRLPASHSSVTFQAMSVVTLTRPTDMSRKKEKKKSSQYHGHHHHHGHHHRGHQHQHHRHHHVPAIAKCIMKKFIRDLWPRFEKPIASRTSTFPTMMAKSSTQRKTICSSCKPRNPNTRLYFCQEEPLVSLTGRVHQPDLNPALTNGS